MTLAISTQELSKAFLPPAGWRVKIRGGRGQPGITAVDQITLNVPQGELFGLLGPNGAGKTTLVKMLTTLIHPTSGTAEVAGYPLTNTQGIRQSVGLVVSDERSFYWRLSGRRNLEFFASMYGLHGDDARRRIRHVLGQVNMTAEADKPFSTYSTGMRQRLAISRSLLHQPQILFLDEPSRSLDPTATVRLHELIGELVDQEQVTIFLITHDLLEAEKLCQRIAVMHQGRIQVVGRPVDLRRRLRSQMFYTLRTDPIGQQATLSLAHLLPDLKSELIGEQEQLFFKAGEGDGLLTAVLDRLRELDIQIYSVEGQPPSLEEVFAHYTGQQSSGEG
jgi:ABC-2 type transport system ATP-binding protein